MIEALQDLDAEKADAKLSRHARSCLYQILGAVSFESGAIQEAIACYQQADALMETVTEPREILEKAVNTMNLGVAYSRLGDLSLAEDYYQVAQSIFEANHEENSVFFPYLLNNLGQLYYKRGAYQDALEYTEMALEKTAKDTPGRTSMLTTCAAVYSILGRFAEAQQRLDEAAALIDRVGATVSGRYDYEQAQMGLYSVTGHLKEATEMGDRLQKRLAARDKAFRQKARVEADGEDLALLAHDGQELRAVKLVTRGGDRVEVRVVDAAAQQHPRQKRVHRDGLAGKLREQVDGKAVGFEFVGLQRREKDAGEELGT